MDVLETGGSVEDYIPLVDEQLKDPVKVQTVSLAPDFYVLTWSAFRDDVWEDKKDFRGQEIYPTEGNKFWLKVYFLGFISLITVTISILLYEVFTNDLYKTATWPIFILRMTLVTFAQKKLQPEFYRGFIMYRYTLNHRHLFSNFAFAIFVPICKILIASVTFSCIILFICMSNSALELIMNFASLSVISDLDNWIGDAIIADKPVGEDDKHKNSLYALDSLNERMKLQDKLSFLDGHLEIVDDENLAATDNFVVISFRAFIRYTPWVLFPLLTIPINYLLLYIQPHQEAVIV